MKGTEIQIAKENVKLQNWAAEVKACQESGMTVVQWCAENGIRPKNYYYHLKRLREAAIGQNGTGYLSDNQSAVGIGRIPDTAGRIEVTDGRVVVRLPSDVMPELLLAAIGGLDNAR